jgi:hypothetical protein
MRIAKTVVMGLMVAAALAVTPAAASPRTAGYVASNSLPNGIVSVRGGFKFRGRRHGGFGRRSFFHGFGHRGFQKRRSHNSFGHGKFRQRGFRKGHKFGGFGYGVGKFGHRGGGRGLRHHGK